MHLDSEARCQTYTVIGLLAGNPVNVTQMSLKGDVCVSEQPCNLVWSAILQNAQSEYTLNTDSKIPGQGVKALSCLRL